MAHIICHPTAFAAPLPYQIVSAPTRCHSRRVRPPFRMQRATSPPRSTCTSRPNHARLSNRPKHHPKPHPTTPSHTSSPAILPQHATNLQREQREKCVRTQRSDYQWTYEAIDGAALIDSLPVSENPNRRWVVMMKRISDRCQKNLDAIQSDSRPLESSSVPVFPSPSRSPTERVPHAKPESHSTSRRVGPQDSSDAFQKYKNQFVTIDMSTVAKDNQFLTDELFGWYRIAGPNPMQIRHFSGDLVEDFPQLTNELFRKIPNFKNDDLITAHEENRLYMVDYAILKDVRTGFYVDGSPKKGLHVYAPKALLAVPSQNKSLRLSLLPIAIQCSQDRSADMFTPACTHTSPSQWRAAKHTVQVADAFVHETIEHFARTHLLMEAFVCATHRSLPAVHPVFRLLKCHFEGTAFINDSSLKNLISPGGLIDNITAPSIEHTRFLAADFLASTFRFNDSMPDVELRHRGVVDGSDGDADVYKSPLHFPYRDDALLLWDAILQWVRDFINSFYLSDEDVQADYELQQWCVEVVQHGRVQGFGDPANSLHDQESASISSREYLTRVISMIIFTASVQHAAVNFPQASHMQFAPAMPLAGYAEAPTRTSRDRVGRRSLQSMDRNNQADDVNDNDEVFMRMMPDLTNAHRQLCAAEMLGVGRYTKLGQYGRHLDFANEDVQAALKRFQERLQHVEYCIQARNCEEGEVALPLYDFLIPSGIPQSVNV